MTHSLTATRHVRRSAPSQEIHWSMVMSSCFSHTGFPTVICGGYVIVLSSILAETE